MKKVSLLLAFAVISFNSFSQYNRVITEKNNDDCSLSFEQVEKSNLPVPVKAAGDVIWEENFDAGMPTGWTLTDDAGIGGWVLTDTAYTGAWTDAADAELDGTPGDDNYLHIPADFYNCTPGVWPPVMVAAPIDLDATVETDWIDISGVTSGIVLQFSNWHRLCCSEADTKLDVNVSVDGTNWTTYNARDINGIVPINDYPPYSGQLATSVMNITSVTSGATQVKIQFRLQGGSHYFWSIDDIQLIESLDNELSIVDYYATNGGVYTVSSGAVDDYNTNFSEVPANIISNPAFGALVHQVGTNGENVMVNAKIDSSANEVFNSLSDAIANFGTDVTVDSVLIANESWYSYNPTLTAADFNNYAGAPDAFENGIPYTFTWEILSDNADANPANNFQPYDYAQTWGRYSYHWQPSDDNATWNNDIGPFSYSSPTGAVGDIYANTFTFEQEAGEEFKIYGLRVFIPSNSRVTFDASGNGVTFTPILHFYDETANAGDGGWVEIEDVTGMPHTLVEGEESDYVYLAFDEMEVDDYTFVNGEYSVGIRLEEYNGQKVAVGVDQTYRQGDSHYLMKIDPWQDTWYYWGTGGSAMIDAYTRLDQFQTDQTVGIEKVSTINNKVKVYPNPTTGIVKIENVENATINVYSLAGNLVKTVESNAVNTSFDLTGLAKGTYLVKVVKENEVITKKINLLK